MPKYVSPVNMNIIMKGRVSPIKMNFNELFNIMKGVYYHNFNKLFHMNIITWTQYDIVGGG